MTMQMKDRLIHKGSNQAIESGSPLHNLLKDRQLLPYFGDDVVAFNSANRQGYTCE